MGTEIVKKTDSENFPDGTPISEWFYDTRMPELEKLGRQYVVV